MIVDAIEVVDRVQGLPLVGARMYHGHPSAVAVAVTTVSVAVAVAEADGAMTVQSLTRGEVAVRSLREGEFIRGVTHDFSQKTWCNVTAIFLVSTNATTFGGFTPDHLILVNKFSNFSTYDDCDATYNAKGQLFTPLSASFCPAMEWSHYLNVMAAIRQVLSKVRKKGGSSKQFLFDLNSYYNNPDDKNNPEYLDALPELCAKTLECSRSQNCEDFESGWADFFKFHLKPTELKIMQRTFPSMGAKWKVGEDPLDGTLSAVVSGVGVKHPILDTFFFYHGAVAVILILCAISVGIGMFFFYRTRRMNNKIKLVVAQPTTSCDYNDLHGEDEEEESDVKKLQMI
eukprot:gene34614-44746_t